jgi:hypothetical protein
MDELKNKMFACANALCQYSGLMSKSEQDLELIKKISETLRKLAIENKIVEKQEETGEVGRKPKNCAGCPEYKAQSESDCSGNCPKEQSEKKAGDEFTIEDAVDSINTLVKKCGCELDVFSWQMVNEAITKRNELMLIYMKAINEIDDFFEYRYEGQTNFAIKKFVMERIDDIVGKMCVKNKKISGS